MTDHMRTYSDIHSQRRKAPWEVSRKVVKAINAQTAAPAMKNPGISKLPVEPISDDDVRRDPAAQDGAQIDADGHAGVTNPSRKLLGIGRVAHRLDHRHRQRRHKKRQDRDEQT